MLIMLIQALIMVMLFLYIFIPAVKDEFIKQSKRVNTILSITYSAICALFLFYNMFLMAYFYKMAHNFLVILSTDYQINITIKKVCILASYLLILIGLSDFFVISPIYVILAVLYPQHCVAPIPVKIVKYFEIFLPFYLSMCLCFIIVFLANDRKVVEKEEAKGKSK